MTRSTGGAPEIPATRAPSRPGVLAWALVSLVVGLLAPAVETVAVLYSSDFRLAGLDARATGILIGGGTLLGWIGSWVTASYHLQRIEPRA